VTRPPLHDKPSGNHPTEAPLQPEAEQGAKPSGREAREAAALRANLRKRKDQARLRETAKVKPESEGGLKD